MMKYLTSATMLIVIISGSPVHAGDYKESDLGRLFTSASTRMAIDKQRRSMKPGPDVQQRRSPSSVTVNGIVKRSDGKSTVWVNGQSNMKMRTINGVKVAQKQRKTDSVSVYVDGELVKIKPGDTWSQKKPDNRIDN